jgi:hypothetical protein
MTDHKDNWRHQTFAPEAEAMFAAPTPLNADMLPTELLLNLRAMGPQAAHALLTLVRYAAQHKTHDGPLTLGDVVDLVMRA